MATTQPQQHQQRFTGSELAERVAASTEVLSSYEGAMLSKSTSAPPKRPTERAVVGVYGFMDLKQRLRLTFTKAKSKSGKVLADAVVMQLGTHPNDLVELKYWDFGEVRARRIEGEAKWRAGLSSPAFGAIAPAVWLRGSALRARVVDESGLFSRGKGDGAIRLRRAHVTIERDND